MTENNMPKPKSTHDWHLFYLHKDSEFLKSVEELKKFEAKRPSLSQLRAARVEIANRYRISLAELNRFITGQILFLNQYEQTARLDIDPANKTGTITFDLVATTKAEILRKFSVIQSMRSKVWGIKPGKVKAAEHPDLIFAMLKARLKNRSYREIFNLYRSGKLPGYSKPGKQFNDEESLERYYRKYEP